MPLTRFDDHHTTDATIDFLAKSVPGDNNWLVRRKLCAARNSTGVLMPEQSENLYR